MSILNQDIDDTTDMVASSNQGRRASDDLDPGEVRM